MATATACGDHGMSMKKKSCATLCDGDSLARLFVKSGGGSDTSDHHHRSCRRADATLAKSLAASGPECGINYHELNNQPIEVPTELRHLYQSTHLARDAVLSHLALMTYS
jgi:hypothetical protein